MPCLPLHVSIPGNETKLGMSRGLPEPKLAAVDAMIDKLTGALFVFQLVVVTVLGTAGNIWKDKLAEKVYFSAIFYFYFILFPYGYLHAEYFIKYHFYFFLLLF